MVTNHFPRGTRVILTRSTPELAADGLTVGSVGKVGITPDGAEGVIFEKHSDTGRYTGLTVLCINTRDTDGKLTRVIDLCERITTNGKA